MRMRRDALAQPAGDPAHEPADRQVAEPVLGDDRVHAEIVGGGHLEAYAEARRHQVLLVVAVERDDGVDEVAIDREHDHLLRLLPGAQRTVQDLERLAGGADEIAVELLLEEAAARRIVDLTELGGDRSAGHQDHVTVGIAGDGIVVAEQADIVRARHAAGIVVMMDERQVRVRIHRVDVPAVSADGEVLDVGIAGVGEEFLGRRVAAIANRQPGRRQQLQTDERHRQTDK